MAITRITSKVDGFRRGGMAHSKEATDHQDNVFTATQLKAIKAEPRLTVEIIEDQEEDPIVKLLKSKVDDVVIRLADASEKTRAQALKLELAKGTKARKTILKALDCKDAGGRAPTVGAE